LRTTDHSRGAALVILTAFTVAVLGVGCGQEDIPPPQATGSPPTVLAAGDIASCTSNGDEATAALLADIEGTVLALGDNAYEHGTAEEYRECYERSWGHHKRRTRPIPGNHEYLTWGAEGYFGYFGKRAGRPPGGYYSYDLGGWHIVALDSNQCTPGAGCYVRSPQIWWLKADLAANEGKPCTLAYMHHPLFSSGKYRPGIPDVKPLWEVLYAANVDVVLSAHDHNYQRFAPQDPEGRANPERGIRQFVVGTGGASHYAIETPIENSEVYNDDTFGILELELGDGSYKWRFVSVNGEKFSDAGSARCH
jgi:acid phosphatase type 7